MACSTAIIASDVGGNNELIENNVNGIIVDPHDIDSFIHEITNLFNYEKLRKSLVENAFKTVEKYDWEQIGNLYLNIYTSILNQK